MALSLLSSMDTLLALVVALQAVLGSVDMGELVDSSSDWFHSLIFPFPHHSIPQHSCVAPAQTHTISWIIFAALPKVSIASIHPWQKGFRGNNPVLLYMSQ